MRAIIVAGTYWGDEGKGKVVHYSVRHHKPMYGGKINGGPNAGHTVVLEDGEGFAFHTLPSTILYHNIVNFIGCGVVVNPQILLDKEIAALKEKGRWSENLMIDGDANVIMPYHLLEDKIKGGAIGTTAQGIGYVYADKDYRTTAIRINDLLDRETLREKVHLILPLKKRNLQMDFQELEDERLKQALASDLESFMSTTEDSMVDTFHEYGRRLGEYVRNVPRILNDAMDKGETVMFEMSQGPLLDKDKGTYPFTTSSNTTAPYAFTGSGTADKGDKIVIGVVKAYPTRVGRGSMPTEITDEKIRDYIIEAGGERGTTTGRVRRPGWPDMVALAYSNMLDGYTELAVTKVDVLGGIPLKICTRYKLDGKETTNFPNDDRILRRVEPQYEEIEGWPKLERKQWLEIAEGERSLPDQLEKYLEIIEGTLKVPVSIVSLGPEVNMTLRRNR